MVSLVSNNIYITDVYHSGMKLWGMKFVISIWYKSSDEEWPNFNSQIFGFLKYFIFFSYVLESISLNTQVKDEHLFETIF